MKKKYLLLVFFAIFMVGGLFAQPGGDHNGRPGTATPIDGGVLLLAAVGTIFATKKIKSLNK